MRTKARSPRGANSTTTSMPHHLGDGVTMTDNLPYNPELAPYESDGVSSGTPDDRWAFTGRSSSANLASIAALAAASRALRGHDDAIGSDTACF